MERKYHYNAEDYYGAGTRYTNLHNQEHRNHDLPSMRGTVVRFYYWCQKDFFHRENGLPCFIHPDGTKEYLLHGEYCKNKTYNYIESNGKRLL